MPYNVYKNGPRKGQPKTLTDSVVRYLEERLDMKEVECRSGKYRQFEKDGSDPFFVGTKGAVRTGKCASKSISVSHLIQPALKNWEKKLIDKE
jgi:hypothetical protein